MAEGLDSRLENQVCRSEIEIRMIVQDGTVVGLAVEQLALRNRSWHAVDGV